MIADPDIIKLVTIKDFETFPQSGEAREPMLIETKFLSNMHGTEWKRIRSLVSPTFTSGKMKHMFDLIKQCLDDSLKALEDQVASSNTLDVKSFWGGYNMNVIGRCCFAVDLNANSKQDNSALKLFQKVFSPDMVTFIVLIFGPKWAVRLMRKLRPRRAYKQIAEIAAEIIEKRRKEQNGSKFHDFLQLMLESEINDKDLNSSGPQSERFLSTLEITSTSFLFLLAGYETTSNLLSWTSWRLAQNPEVQEKLYQEVSQLKQLTYEAVVSLPYLEAVLNETLRIDTPVPVTQRIGTRAYLIPGTKTLIPKGVTIVIPMYTVHHDPEYYPESEVFKPERFLPENKESIKPYTFLPFGMGPKNCVGMRFAMVNAKLALCAFIRKYELFVHNNTTINVKYQVSSVFTTAKDLRVGIRARKVDLEE